MYRVRTVWSSPVGGPYLSTHYVLEADPLNPSQTEAQAAVDAVGAFWTTVDANVSNDLSWAVEASVDVIAPDSGTLTGSFGVTPPSGVGGGVSGMGPAAAQGLVRWITSQIRNGRRIRGRTNVPGVDEAFITDGRLSGAAIANILSAANTLVGAVDLVIWSRPSAPLATDGVAAQVDSAAVWNEFAVLTGRRD